MAVNIVTGMTGIEHITSHDDRARNASQFGRGKYVFDIGRKFSATAVDDNLVRIQDGMCINQGTQMGIEPNDYADVEIDNGLLGTNRHDIIVMRYEKNEETLLEKASLAVVKGVNSSEPVDPEVTEGNILDGGDLVDDMPLYRVVIEGVNLVSIEPLFEVFDGDVGSILEELEDKVDKVTGKGLSTNDYTNEDKAKVDGIPTKTSDLENDSDFVSDADYVHTDNNYTNADKEDVAKIDNLEHSLSLTSTATGNPISISDSAHVNAEELKVELEPIQDLHGYDKPWVGGAGKNLIQIKKDYALNLDGITVDTISDEDGNILGIDINGTATKDLDFFPYETIGLSKNSYYITTGLSQEYVGFQLVVTPEYLGVKTSRVFENVTLSSIYANIKNGTVFNHLKIYSMTCLNSETDKSYEPYSNICPISGYDSTSIVRSGKNLVGNFIENTVIDYITGAIYSNNNYKTTDYILVQKNTPVTISGKGNGRERWFYDREKEPVEVVGSSDGTYTPNEDGYIRISVENSNNNLQLELGSTATSYEPYTADTYTLQFGETVYGAEVDFVSGVATVTKGYIAEYAGEALPSTWISDRDVYASGTTPTTGAEVVYELATPYTIQLTPQQIKMLKGNNVLVADGDMNLTYQVDSVVGDVKEWAENEFLPKSSATAQHNYSTQEQIVGTWIDGSTVYEKTIVATNLQASNQIAHGISDFDKCISAIGMVDLQNGSTASVPYMSITSQTTVLDNSIQFGFANSTKIDMRVGSSLLSSYPDLTVTITIQYTKTTE